MRPGRRRPGREARRLRPGKGRACSYGEPPLGEFAAGFFGAVDGDAALEPARELGETFVEIDLGAEAEHLAGERDVGETMADVSGAMAPGDLRADVRAAQDGGEAIGHLVDRHV